MKYLGTSNEKQSFPSHHDSPFIVHSLPIKNQRETNKKPASPATRPKRNKAPLFDLTPSTPMAIGKIPVIDFKKFPDQLPDLLKACEEWSCFRLVNHTISPEMMSEMKSIVRSLLDLPPEIKRRNTDIILGSGYVAPSSRNPLYEGLGLFDVDSPAAVETFCDQLGATSQQRETFQSYSHKLHELAINISEKIAESLDLECGLFQGWPSQFRINKYSFTEESLGKYGVQIHTDSGFLTILHDDDSVGGLEVMQKSGEFAAVDPLPGSLVVNLGDVATAWSNGRFLNVKHRVMCKQAAIRVSIAMFLLGPPKGVAIEAPAKLVDSDHPRLYRPFTFEDHRSLRLYTRQQAGETMALYLLD